MQATQTVHITEHEIHAIFALRSEAVRKAFEHSVQSDQFEKTLSVLSHTADALSDIFGDNLHADASAPLWTRIEPNKGLNVGDFHPHVQQILGQKGQPMLCQSYALSAPHVLSQVKGGKPRLREFSLGSAAQKRCGRNSVQVQLSNARLFLFRTGIVLLDLSWVYRQPGLTAEVLLESNYLLSHDYPGRGKDDQISAHQYLRRIAQAIIPSGIANEHLLQQGRLILYTLAVVRAEQAHEALPTLAGRLALRQTSDYQIDEQSFARNLYRPYPYLCHAASVEGGASVVDGMEAQVSEFVQGFVRDKGPNVYLPLFIAAMHSHFWLLAQSQTLPSQTDRTSAHQEKRRIAEIYEDTIEYRRFFSPVLVSGISTHNAFYDQWRDALALPQRTHEVEDISKITVSLLQERRTRWISRISGAIGGFLVGHELLDALAYNGIIFNLPPLTAWIATYPNMAHTMLEMNLHRIEMWEKIVFLGSLASAALGWWVAWKFETALNKE